MMFREKLYKKIADSVRMLIMDSISLSGSGHAGLPLGMADVASVLFTDFLKFSPLNPKWQNRDRFVLSAGHGSILLYSLLYLFKYKDINLEDLKNFRKFKSKAAGHPEYRHFFGIETSTGPLGQGVANAVGMGLSAKFLQQEFGQKVIDHKIYVLASDGCLMEGISHEAASFAGHRKLNNLIILFDNNKISIDGSTDLSCSDDHIQRFNAYGWSCFEVDGHNYQQIYEVLKLVQNQSRPCFISFNTIIGQGSLSEKTGTSKIHSGSFSKTEVANARKYFGFPEESFSLPEDIEEILNSLMKEKDALFRSWQNSIETQTDLKTRLAKKSNFVHQEVLSEIYEDCSKEILREKLCEESTRKSSKKVLKHLNKYLPNFIGGSADLSESTCMDITAKNYIHYGVREHAMAGIMNGLALSEIFIPYGSSFLVFSDYMRPAIRLACLMKLKLIYVMTHDSIGVGEDGPTHQPVEHLESLRMIPNLYVFRPANAMETLESWLVAISLNSPSLIALTRQDVKQPEFYLYNETNNCYKGAYIVEEDQNYSILIIATGSELSLAVDVKKALSEEKLGVKLVSMVCRELFDEQTEYYKQSILGHARLKVAIEASTEGGWKKYIGDKGLFFGVNNFGLSGSAEDLYKNFGLTVENIANKIGKKFKDLK